MFIVLILWAAQINLLVQTSPVTQGWSLTLWWLPQLCWAKESLHLAFRVWPLPSGNFHSLSLVLPNCLSVEGIPLLRWGWGRGDPVTSKKILTQPQWDFGDGVFPRASAHPELLSKYLLVIRASDNQCLGWKGLQAMVSSSATPSLSHVTLPMGKNAMKLESKKNHNALWKLQARGPSNLLCFETRDRKHFHINHLILFYHLIRQKLLPHFPNVGTSLIGITQLLRGFHSAITGVCPITLGWRYFTVVAGMGAWWLCDAPKDFNTAIVGLDSTHDLMCKQSYFVSLKNSRALMAQSSFFGSALPRRITNLSPPSGRKVLHLIPSDGSIQPGHENHLRFIKSQSRQHPGSQQSSRSSVPTYTLDRWPGGTSYVPGNWTLSNSGDHEHKGLRVWWSTECARSVHLRSQGEAS